MTKRVRIGILSCLTLVLLATIGMTVSVLVHSHRGAVDIGEVERLIAAGELDRARGLLARVLRKDANHERAMRMMADISERECKFVVAAQWLGKLVKLNEFEKSYQERYRRSIVRSRDFKNFKLAFANLPKGSRRPDDTGWCVYAAHMTAGLAAAEKDYRAWCETRGEQGGATPLAKMLNFVFTAPSVKGMTVSNVVENLKAHAASEDEGVRQEALLALSNVYISTHEFDLSEKALDEVIAFNPVVATPRKVRLLLMTNRISEAIELNGEFLKRHPDGLLAIEQAELLAAAKRIDLLPKLAALFQRNNFATIAFKNYLDALAAYDRGDFDKLAELIDSTRSLVRTPWAMRMAALAHLHAHQPNRLAQLEEDWRLVRRMKPFFDCHDIVWKAAKQALIEEYEAGRPVAELVSLATAIQLPGEREDVELTRIVALAGITAGTMTMRELETIVKRHGKDVSLLQMAAEAALLNERPDEAIAYAERVIETGTNVQVAASIRLRARFAKAEAPRASETAKAEASDELKRFLKAFPKIEDVDRDTIWRYVSEMANLDDVKAFKAADSTYAPFCDILIMEASGRRQAALDALEKLNPTNHPSLLYWSAHHLAVADRNAAALARYQALPEAFLKQDVYTQLNMSELYASLGDTNAAFGMAETAWKAAAGDAAVQTCYARRLSERGDWAKICSVAKLPADPAAANPKLLAIWIPAMEKRIAAEWSSNQQIAMREACRQLLRYSQKNKVAIEYIAKYDDWMAKRREKREGRSGEKPRNAKIGGSQDS